MKGLHILTFHWVLPLQFQTPWPLDVARGLSLNETCRDVFLIGMCMFFRRRIHLQQHNSVKERNVWNKRRKKTCEDWHVSNVKGTYFLFPGPVLWLRHFLNDDTAGEEDPHQDRYQHFATPTHRDPRTLSLIVERWLKIQDALQTSSVCPFSLTSQIKALDKLFSPTWSFLFRVAPNSE